MPFPTLYTAASIVWYSTANLFVKSTKFYSGDTKVFKFTNKNKKALILLHGISGTGDSGYIKHAYGKLKNKYDLYAPEYGTSKKHLYPTYLPVKEDPVFERDVVSLYRDLCKEYDQISFVAFSAGGGALMMILNTLVDEDLEKLNTTFFVSPALEMEFGFKYLEKVWFPVLFFMKYDYWKKFFWWIKDNKGWKEAFKFYFSCRTFDDVFKYFSGKDAKYPELEKDVLSRLNKKLVLLHPDDDPIVKLSSSLRFLKDTNISRINQLVGGHIGFKALDRFAQFYQDDENVAANDLWDMSKIKEDDLK